MKQCVLPVISDFKTFEKFLKSDQEWCILMDFHMNFLVDLLMQLHQHQKKGLLHMDLCHGLTNDQYGVQYACQKAKVDGIISTKPKAIQEAKVNRKIAILRAFMIDTRSYHRSIELANLLKPDYMEILPAILPHIATKIHQECDVKLIGGGLIETREDIERCLEDGMEFVSLSKQELWEVNKE